jgi:hypothetical protein
MGFRKPLFILRLDELPGWEYMGSGESHVRFEAPQGIKIVAFGLGPLMRELDRREKNIAFVVELDRETWLKKESVVVFVRDIIRNFPEKTEKSQ